MPCLRGGRSQEGKHGRNHFRVLYTFLNASKEKHIFVGICTLKNASGNIFFNSYMRYLTVAVCKQSCETQSETFSGRQIDEESCLALLY